MLLAQYPLVSERLLLLLQSQSRNIGYTTSPTASGTKPDNKHVHYLSF
jgi:hypothetical protein